MFKNTASFLRAAFIGSALIAQAASCRTQKTDVKKPILFQMLAYQYDSMTARGHHYYDLREQSHKAHDSAQAYLGAKAKSYSYAYIDKPIDLDPMIHDIKKKSRHHKGVLPITLLVAHGGPEEFISRDKKHNFVDTFIYDNRFLSNIKSTQRKGKTKTFVDDRAMAGYFGNVAWAEKHRPGVNIMANCHTAAGIRGTSHLPGQSQTVFFTSAKDTAWFNDNEFLDDLGQDEKTDLTKPETCVKAVIKHVTIGYRNYINRPIIAVTMDEPSQKLKVNKDEIMLGPRDVRIIDVDCEMATLYDKFSEDEVLEVADDMGTLDDLNPSMVEAADDIKKLHDYRTEAKKLVILAQPCNQAATLNALVEDRQMRHYQRYEDSYADMRMLTYEVCRRHLDKMPNLNSYFLEHNVRPDHRRSDLEIVVTTKNQPY